MEEEEEVSGSKEKGWKQEAEGGITYCVTGASGYIGSWLVKSLLDRGYNVHATVRHPEKVSHLLRLWGGGKRLKLFTADLQEEGSFDEAVKGCSGLFHVAATMDFEVPVKENVGNTFAFLSWDLRSRAKEKSDTIMFRHIVAGSICSYVQTNVIEPAIRGTLNVLKSCLRSRSIRRVVFTSSISTMTAKDSSGNWKSFVDESSKVSINHVWENKPSGWVYVLSKLLTEEAAFEFSEENEIDLVSVVTTTVAGPFLTSTVPTSIRVLLSPLTGDPQPSSILETVNSRMGSIALVHIEDICNAHIFLMEHGGAIGRYICSTKSCGMSEVVGYLIEEYPYSNLQRIVGEHHNAVPAEISSKKLKDLGFKYIHGVQDVIHDTIGKCMECGFLPEFQNE